MKNDFSDFSQLETLKESPVSEQMDELFKEVINEKKSIMEPMAMATSPKTSADELSLDDMGEFEVNITGDKTETETSQLDEGMELSFSDDESIDLLAGSEEIGVSSNHYGDLSLDSDDLSLNISKKEEHQTAVRLDASVPGDDFSLSGDDETLDRPLAELTFDEGADDFSSELPEDDSLSLDDLDLSEDDSPLDFGPEDDVPQTQGDLSDDAKEKLKEIDAIMDMDASHIGIVNPIQAMDENLDRPLVSEDLDLGSLDFGNDEIVEEPKETKRKKKENSEDKDSLRNFGQDLKEISGVYSGEMERMQATISNLRTDREELLAKIQRLEEDKILQSRQSLTMRAELDEKKIELTIIRKKLNEEINELKDRLKFFDEKRLILEEKNRVLVQELDKSAQKNKIDVKKVQLRERELEQKFELLKSDAESQIRHRDLKILELKRKIDAMEFDMESISTQEKRSVESRFELEDKLEKAIKTLRSAITVLEDESEHSNALDALKKNLNM